MARITVEDCLTKEMNRFALVLLASKRTKQILHGAKVTLDREYDNKSVVMALREIAGGKVRFMTEDEVKEAARLAEERLAQSRAAAAEVIPVDPLAGLSAVLESSPAAIEGGSSGEAEEEVKPAGGLNGDNAF